MNITLAVSPTDHAPNPEELHPSGRGLGLQPPESAEDDADSSARGLPVRCDARQCQPLGLPQGAGDGHGKMIGRAKA